MELVISSADIYYGRRGIGQPSQEMTISETQRCHQTQMDLDLLANNRLVALFQVYFSFGEFIRDQFQLFVNLIITGREFGIISMVI